MLLIFIGIIVCFGVLKIILELTKGLCKSSVCLVGKVAVVTGGNSGIGYETALNFASRGCKVIIADIADGSGSAKKIIQETQNPNVTYKYVDIENFGAIRTFCKELNGSEEKIDILVNNAGILEFNRLTKGLPKVIQVNYLGPFLLTHLLADLLKKSKNARIVFVISRSVYFHMPSFPSLHKIPVKSKLEAISTYTNSKLFCLIASKMFGEKLKSFGVSSNAVCPGPTITPMGDGILFYFRKISWIFYVCTVPFRMFCKTPAEGAQTILYCALEVVGSSGNFYADCRPVGKPKIFYDEVYCAKLWEESEQLVGLTEDEKL